MEPQILQLLQQAPDTLFSMKEVGRKVDRDRYRESPNWARPFLEALVSQGSIEKDENGLFFFPKPEKKLKLGRIV